MFGILSSRGLRKIEPFLLPENSWLANIIVLR